LFVAAGLYYLSPEFIALTPRGRPVDMPELLTLGASAGLRIGLFPVHEYWKDIGRPGDLQSAHDRAKG
jgi:NDP-sugar pyrophosphorylase family protein